MNYIMELTLPVITPIKKAPTKTTRQRKRECAIRRRDQQRENRKNRLMQNSPQIINASNNPDMNCINVSTTEHLINDTDFLKKINSNELLSYNTSSSTTASSSSAIEAAHCSTSSIELLSSFHLNEQSNDLESKSFFCKCDSTSDAISSNKNGIQDVDEAFNDLKPDCHHHIIQSGKSFNDTSQLSQINITLDHSHYDENQPVLSINPGLLIIPTNQPTADKIVHPNDILQVDTDSITLEHTIVIHDQETIMTENECNGTTHHENIETNILTFEEEMKLLKQTAESLLNVRWVDLLESEDEDELNEENRSPDPIRNDLIVNEPTKVLFTPREPKIPWKKQQSYWRRIPPCEGRIKCKRLPKSQISALQYDQHSLHTNGNSLHTQSKKQLSMDHNLIGSKMSQTKHYSHNPHDYTHYRKGYPLNQHHYSFEKKKNSSEKIVSTQESIKQLPDQNATVNQGIKKTQKSNQIISQLNHNKSIKQSPPYNHRHHYYHQSSSLCNNNHKIKQTSPTYLSTNQSFITQSLSTHDTLSNVTSISSPITQSSSLEQLIFPPCILLEPQFHWSIKPHVSRVRWADLEQLNETEKVNEYKRLQPVKQGLWYGASNISMLYAIIPKEYEYFSNKWNAWYQSPFYTQSMTQASITSPTTYLIGNIHTQRDMWDIRGRIKWEHLPIDSVISVIRQDQQLFDRTMTHEKGTELIIRGFPKSISESLFSQIVLGIILDYLPGSNTLTQISLHSHSKKKGNFILLYSDDTKFNYDHEFIQYITGLIRNGWSEFNTYECIPIGYYKRSSFISSRHRIIPKGNRLSTTYHPLWRLTLETIHYQTDTVNELSDLNQTESVVISKRLIYSDTYLKNMQRCRQALGQTPPADDIHLCRQYAMSIANRCLVLSILCDPLYCMFHSSHTSTKDTQISLQNLEHHSIQDTSIKPVTVLQATDTLIHSLIDSELNNNGTQLMSSVSSETVSNNSSFITTETSLLEANEHVQQSHVVLNTIPTFNIHKEQNDTYCHSESYIIDHISDDPMEIMYDPKKTNHLNLSPIESTTSTNTYSDDDFQDTPTKSHALKICSMGILSSMSNISLSDPLYDEDLNYNYTGYQMWDVTEPSANDSYTLHNQSVPYTQNNVSDKFIDLTNSPWVNESNVIRQHIGYVMQPVNSQIMYVPTSVSSSIVPNNESPSVIQQPTPIQTNQEGPHYPITPHNHIIDSTKAANNDHHHQHVNNISCTFSETELPTTLWNQTETGYTHINKSYSQNILYQVYPPIYDHNRRDDLSQTTLQHPTIILYPHPSSSFILPHNLLTMYAPNIEANSQISLSYGDRHSHVVER